MKLIIEDDEGRKTVIPLVRDEISIGRLEGNTIRLTERNVSRRHARLLKQSGSILVEDLGSSNGVRVNGERIDARQALRDGDLIEIGDYDLAIEGLPRTVAEPKPAARPPAQPRNNGDTDVTERVNLSSESESARDLPPARRPHLVGLNGAFWGEELPLTKTVVSFGRAQDVNDIVIDHPSISRVHGKFRFENGEWSIYDAQSSYGVKVNGQPFASTTVRPGDQLEIGQAQFRFCAPGEDFTPEPPQSSREETQVVRQPKSKTGLIVGVIVAVVVVAGGAVAAMRFLQPQKPTDAPIDNYCQKAQAAINQRDWATAVQSLSVAKQLGTQCGFAIEPALQSAQANQEVKSALDEADTLKAAKKYRQIVQALEHVPEGSPYFDAARAKVAETRLEGTKDLSMQAQEAIEKGHLDDAASKIAELQQLDPNAFQISLLQKSLAEKKQKTAPPPTAVVKQEAPANGTTPPATTVTQAPTPPPPPPATAEKTSEERNRLAKTAIAEGIGLMQKGDFEGGIARFQAAIAEKPESDYIAIAHKNIGVGYAKQHKAEDALPHLKIYLRLKPNAPDRAMIEQLVQQVEARHGQ